MPTKRIEYVDALRGFTMYLVVYAHIWSFGYHADGKDSFTNILVNFFLVLFFFVSGYVAYKKDAEWSLSFVGTLLKKKFVQLIIPAVIFCTIFCWWRGHGIETALAPSNAGYWFTIHLFYFYVFYSFPNLVFKKGRAYDLFLLLFAMVIFCISFSHELIERTQLGADLFHYLGMKNWRFYLFFCIGILIRKHFDSFVKLTDNRYWMALFVLGFFAMVFCANKITLRIWQPLNMLIYGILSIIVIFTFFRKHEGSFRGTTKLGYCLQFIGKRTMDIYMIHYFLLPRNLNVLGKAFTDYVNPSMEFLVTTIIALLVITLCMVIGSIIRLSPFLSHYLLGTK